MEPPEIYVKTPTLTSTDQRKTSLRRHDVLLSETKNWRREAFESKIWRVSYE